MAGQLERPILMGGVGLSLVLWLLQGVQHSASGIGHVSLLIMMAGSAGLWWFNEQFREPLQGLTPPEPLNQNQVEQAIAQTQNLISRLATEAQTRNAGQAVITRLAALQEQATQLNGQLDRTSLRVAVTGNKAVGKTAVLRLLEANGLGRTPQSLSFIEANLEQPQTFTLADVLLFVTSGDLTDPEFKMISQRVAAQQRTILVWNKQDQYLEGEQPVILQQLKTTLAGVLSVEDISAIAAAPNPVKVRQHQADGSVKEWMEAQPPIIQSLCDRLSHILKEEQQALVWATTYREALALRQDAKAIFNQLRREQALPVIEQYQWLAGAATAANPVPALDMLATAAVNAQLVMDLGAIYEQKFSLQQAQEVATTIGTQMLKLGFVELSTQSLTSLLKSNTVTFVAGSLVQGVSAGYLTRIAGLSLIEYFQAQDLQLDPTENPALNFDTLINTLKAVFQQNQQISLLQSFVKQAVTVIKPKQSLESPAA